LFLSLYQFILNMDEAFYCILSTVRAWKLNCDKDGRHVKPITDIQTAQAQTCTDTLGQKNLLHPPPPQKNGLTRIAHSRTEIFRNHSFIQPWKSIFTSIICETWNDKMDKKAMDHKNNRIYVSEQHVFQDKWC
jgi:hypothetical protein